MQKPAGKHRGKAARDIAFLSNRLDSLEAELKRIQERKKVIQSAVYQLYCHKCGGEMGLGNEIQAHLPRTCARCATRED